MKEIDWNIIFKLKEFGELLCDKDFIQLSMGSKKSRKLLVKDALYVLNLRSFTSSKGYSNIFLNDNTGIYGKILNIFSKPYKYLTNEFTESKREFIKDLKQFNVNPKEFVLDEYGACHFLLNEIPSIFPNITTLVLSSSLFTMDALEYLLNNFKSLKNLELAYNSIYTNPEISNDYNITYPITLRSLKLGTNIFIRIRNRPSSIDTQMHLEDDFDLYTSPQHFPSLVTFEYEIDGYLWRNERVYQFIKLNPQLTTLKLSGWGTYSELFNAIKDCENLTHLENKCVYDGDENDELEYGYPMLRSINYLYILFGFSDCFTGSYIPNVTDLEIEMNNMDISRSFKQYIQSFTKLKSLKLIFNNYSKILNLTLPKLNYLEKLEVNLNYDEGKLMHIRWDVSTCDRLKLVTITKSEFYDTFEKFKLNLEFNNSWNFLYFPHKLAYYKKP